jgi:hypothetical protein
MANSGRTDLAKMLEDSPDESQMCSKATWF